jgi:hypothetical protein
MPPRDTVRAFLVAGAVTAVVDGLFSSALTVFAYGAPVTRLWQSVASTLLGATAMTGGTPAVVVGLSLHVLVAFTWAAVLVFGALRLAAVRRLLARPAGPMLLALAYGPLIWIVMSCAVIPAFTHRPPAINARWWVQLLGHVPFVALPMAIVARGLVTGRR